MFRKARTLKLSKSETWTASIDAFRHYDIQDHQWHLSAIEFHHKNKDQAEKLRDEVFEWLISR